MQTRNLKRVAWGLIIFVAVFWVSFGIASAVEEHLGVANAVLHVFAPGGTFAILGVLARRWRTPAAIALMAIGAFVAIAYPLVYLEFFPASTVVVLVATMAVPPLAAGFLLLLSRSHPRAPGGAMPQPSRLR